jgi:ADP-ribosylglycohydrolase
MRAGPVGWAFDTLEETLLEAEKTAAPTHNHREGIKGAKATAAAVYLARNGKTKAEIKDFIEKTYKYKLNVPLNRIRKHAYAGTCQRDVPAALICFLESSDFINSIQVAISVGGDTDTIACITGSIAEAFYKNIPLWAIKFAHEKLGEDMKGVIGTFYEKYIKKYGLVYGIPDEVDMLV